MCGFRVHWKRPISKQDLVGMVGTHGVLRQHRSMATLQAVWRSRKAFLSLLKKRPDMAEAIVRRRASTRSELTPSAAISAHALQATSTVDPKQKQLQRDKRLAVSQAHVSKWVDAGKYWSASQRLVDDLERAKVHRASVVSANADSIKEVSHFRELAEVPYWNQGNADLYTDDALHQRFKLRRHSRVVGILEQWWAMILRSVQAVTGDPSTVVLDKHNYCKLLCIIYKALLKPYNAREAWESAQAPNLLYPMYECCANYFCTELCHTYICVLHCTELCSNAALYFAVMLHCTSLQ